MGRDLCRAVLTYDSNVKCIKDEMIEKDNEKKLQKLMNKSIFDEIKRMDVKSEIDGDDSNGSDSEPSCDNLENDILTNLLPGKKKKKKRENTNHGENHQN